MSDPSFLLLIEERRGVPVKRQRLGVIPTAANHFHYPGQKAVESRPLIGTDHPPLVSPPRTAASGTTGSSGTAANASAAGGSIDDSAARRADGSARGVRARRIAAGGPAAIVARVTSGNSEPHDQNKGGDSSNHKIRHYRSLLSCHKPLAQCGKRSGGPGKQTRFRVSLPVA
jgi:hypothetical protein